MSENVKKIRELEDFNVGTEISRDDLLIVATGPDTRRDSEGDADPISPKTVKATIEAIITAYNKSLIPPSGGGSTTDPSDRPNAEVPKPGGGTYFQDTTPFTAANLELMIGSGCGLTVVEECHNENEVSVDCSSVDMKYKTKKLCLGNIPSSALDLQSGSIDPGVLALDNNDDLELVNGNLKVKEGVSSPGLAPGGGLTLDEDGNLKLETDPEQFGFIAYINANGGPTGTTDNAGGNITNHNGRRVIGDRFTTWANFFNFANNNITSNKGTISVIFESDITLPAQTNRASMAFGPTLPLMQFFGNKKVGEKYLGINTAELTSADFQGSNQRRAKIICDLTNAPESHAFMTVHSSVEFYLLHFQFAQSNKAMYAWARTTESTGSLLMVASKVECTSPKNAYISSAFEAISNSLIEFRTMNSAFRGAREINPLNPSDPFFHGGGLKVPAIEIKNFGAGGFTAGRALHAWDSNNKIKMVEYQAGVIANGTNTEWMSDPNMTSSFTGDSRVHLSGTNKFNNFLEIADMSIFYTNGPICSKTSGSSTAAQFTDAGISASAFNSLSLQGWADGVNHHQRPYIPGVGLYSGTADVDYRLRGLPAGGAHNFAVDRSDYPD